MTFPFQCTKINLDVFAVQAATENISVWKLVNHGALYESVFGPCEKKF